MKLKIIGRGLVAEDDNTAEREKSHEVDRQRLEGNGTRRHGSARQFLLLHDSLVGGFYRHG